MEKNNNNYLMQNVKVDNKRWKSTEMYGDGSEHKTIKRVKYNPAKLRAQYGD